MKQQSNDLGLLFAFEESASQLKRQVLKKCKF